MTEKMAGIRSLTTYSENPYIPDGTPNRDGQRRKTEILYDGKQAIINNETGEVLDDHLAIARIKWVETDQFVKVYTANVSIFFELSKSAQRVCEYLIAELGKRNGIGNDRIMLYYEDYKAWCDERGAAGSSGNTFNRGLRELASKALIAKANRRDHWFINPAVMFNGDRARFITEVRRKRKSQAEIAEDHGQIPLIPRLDGEATEN